MKISVILTNNKALSEIVRILLSILIKIIRSLKKLFTQINSDSIVIIAFRKLGDSVFTIPAQREIYNSFCKDVYIFCFEESKPIFEYFFDSEFIIPFKHSDFYFNSRMVKGKIRKKLNKLNPQKIFDFTGSTISASLLINSNATDIIGINESYYEAIYTKYLPFRKLPHIMDMYLNIVQDEIPPYTDTIKKFDIKLNKDGYILIHPFAGWKAKEWNLKKFIELADQINQRYRIIIIAEQGRLNDEIKQDIFNLGIDIYESIDVYELIKIINGASIIISNDSGPLYIASMLGKPTFTIYGPTNPKYSLPYGKYHDFIQENLKCSPKDNAQYCFTNAGRRGCPAFECMNILSVHSVYVKVNSFINKFDISER